MKTIRVLLMWVLAAGLSAAQAQTGKWPDKPVRVVVPFAPGGSTDIIARVLTVRLSQEFGQQFVVDNRSGAGGSIGTDIVVRANPDGYTLIIVATSYATNAALYKLPYDPVKDIAPIGMLHKGPFALAVNSSVTAGNVKDFIELARSRPRALTYGSSGIGGATHLATRTLHA
jgi:tripartite-type tricarboxylate transporter receptor subunit TctC